MFKLVIASNVSYKKTSTIRLTSYNRMIVVPNITITMDFEKNLRDANQKFFCQRRRNASVGTGRTQLRIDRFKSQFLTQSIQKFKFKIFFYFSNSNSKGYKRAHHPQPKPIYFFFFFFFSFKEY